MAEKLFKVLKEGQSFNGGDLKWSLPRKQGEGYRPGEWHEVSGEIQVCCNGLHLTNAPYNKWYEWGCTVYEAQGEGDSSTEEDKTAFRRARLLRPAQEPEWLIKTKELVKSINDIQWLKPQATPKPEWKVYPTRAAAWDAARAAAWDAAGDAAGDAARDARLNTYMQGICSDLFIDEKHRQHVIARWEVWQLGYGLLCDVDGVLYVYEKVV